MVLTGPSVAMQWPDGVNWVICGYAMARWCYLGHLWLWYGWMVLTGSSVVMLWPDGVNWVICDCVMAGWC